VGVEPTSPAQNRMLPEVVFKPLAPCRHKSGYYSTREVNAYGVATGGWHPYRKDLAALAALTALNGLLDLLRHGFTPFVVLVVISRYGYQGTEKVGLGHWIHRQ
jgi:hypothetical protein